ncbi:hypothetical protein DWB61_06130 [Ancylomarina euxinus]|uniref:Uncharacterized protein n=1 Tax=Ancylomarina euxinus TaxID=2283627 RepID=A0A425Y418_9BACT|nr:hypothetical protein [Ancylomarina euxinus]MCZ4694614.1 hypothetical protein [Ancylomarina euxinus]MUP14157.1 hypothetical protein [Ancylomarina euxinus]RRG23013.1 hypothetical protein DWB61_06130 [Ancylomarina euxinus]
MEELFVFDSKDEVLSVYCNEQKEEDVTLLIGVFDMSDNGCLVSYIEYKNSPAKLSRQSSSYIEQIRDKYDDVNYLPFKVKM